MTKMNPAAATAAGKEGAVASLLDSALWSGRVYTGAWRRTDSTITVREPATCEVGVVGRWQPSDLAAVVATARTAQAAWAARPADKDPFIVLEDADLEAAAAAGAWGSFLHQGQICMASGRHIVVRKVVEYLRILAAGATPLTGGEASR